MDVQVDPQPAAGPGASPIASERGAGPLGFSGVRDQADVTTTGLTTLGNAEFGEGPSVPLLPSTWDSELKE